MNETASAVTGEGNAPRKDTMSPMEYEMARNGLTRAFEMTDDLLRESNHKLGAQVEELTKLLSEAWEIGADHRKPTFEQLNAWRAVIAEVTKKT